MELSFTDALISTDMIGAMIGATDSNTGKTAGEGMWLKTETVTVTSSVAAAVQGTLATTAPTYGNVSTNPYVCYYRKEGTTDWIIGKMDRSTKKFSPADAQTNMTDGNYCVKYFAMNAQGYASNDVSFNLNADFVPSVLHAISYIDVYEAGNAGCSGGTGTSTGRAVGQLVIDIPLFQLNNGLNLQLSTTPGTYDISGKALATETAACTGNARTFGKIYYVKTAA